MTRHEPFRTVAPAQPAVQPDLNERPYLLLEDLVVEPIPFELSDFGALAPELQDPLPH